MVFDLPLAEIVPLAQRLVDGEDQSEENTEADGPSLVAGCALVAAPHQATPRFENLDDPFSLDLEEGQLDLPLHTTRGRSWRVMCAEMVLDPMEGFFIKDEASFEYRAGDVNFQGLPKKFNLVALSQSLGGSRDRGRTS